MLKGVEKILIFKWSALGDIILAIPSLRAIRRYFPNSKLFILIKKEYQELLSFSHLVDNFIEFEKSNWKGLISKLRKEKFDLSIDFQNTWRSHLLAFLGRVKNRVGYQRKGGKFLLNIAVAEPSVAEKFSNRTNKVKNPVEHQAYLLSKIGIKLDNPELVCSISYPSTFNIGQPYICILPGAGEGWQSKCWSELSFARLADSLISKLKYSVVFLGEKRERGKIERIKKAMSERAEDLVGRTNLLQLAGVLKDSLLFITHDTGPMHLAQALKVPTIALFGPTDPRRHTFPSVNLFIIKKALDCQPCERRKCSSQQCMQLIQVEEVIDKIKEILNSYQRKEDRIT